MAVVVMGSKATVLGVEWHLAPGWMGRSRILLAERVDREDGGGMARRERQGGCEERRREKQERRATENKQMGTQSSTSCLQRSHACAQLLVLLA